MKRFTWIALATLVACLNPISVSCNFFEDSEPLACKVTELRENPSSRYYDAVVRVKSVALSPATKSRFTLVTSTDSYELTTLTFIEEGNDPGELEPGDTFIVPLSRPDWKFYIRRELNQICCSVDFWEMLPEADRWHPLKSEAMEVALSLKMTETDGVSVPVPGFFPGEWEIAVEVASLPGKRWGVLEYRKMRVDEIKEEVNVSFGKLTGEEEAALEEASATDFLMEWTEWTRKFGQPGSVGGHEAVCWDMKGYGEFGWSYRYIYIDDGTLIEVTVDSDPLEWMKTEPEKEEERKTRRVFIDYSYGPVGEPEWDISIVIRANGEGSFEKLSGTGISVTKLFSLTEGELDEIEMALLDNDFLEMESYSGEPGDTYSSMTVKYDDIWWAVDMWDVTTQAYSNIAQKIQDMVLPKVGETP